MYCSKCGEKIMDEAVVCPKCGCLVGDRLQKATSQQKNHTKTTLQTTTLAFLIIAVVLQGFFLITLAWTLPMTLSYNRRINENEPIGVGFKVCTLIFVSFIAGILMLCDKK